MSKKINKSQNKIKSKNKNEDEEFEAIIKQMNEENKQLLKNTDDVTPDYYTLPSIDILPYSKDNNNENNSVSVNNVICLSFASKQPILWQQLTEFIKSDFSSPSVRITFCDCLKDINKSIDIGNEPLFSYTNPTPLTGFKMICEEAIHEIEAIEKYNSTILITTSVLEKIKEFKSKLEKNFNYPNLSDDFLSVLNNTTATYQIYKEHYPLFASSYLLIGYCKWAQFLSDPTIIMKIQNNGCLDSETLEKVISFQIIAAFVAFYNRGWRKSPDAICLRGLCQYFRGNTSEAVKDLNNSIKSKRTYKNKWHVPEMEGLAETFLNTSRGNSKPLNVNYIELANNSVIGQRYGAAYCHGTDKDRHKLYLFGGLYASDHNKSFDDMILDGDISATYRQIATDINTKLQDEKACPLNDLNVFDFIKEKWYKIKVIGNSPSPRGFAKMKYNPNDNCLWLIGGRSKYVNEGNSLKDIWCFKFSNQKWNKIGNTPSDINDCIIGDVIYKNKWYIVFIPEGTKTILIKYFDLKTLKWVSIIPQNNYVQPNLKTAESCSWFYENKLYLYAAQEASDINKSQNKLDSLLWILNFIEDTKTKSVKLEWIVDVIVGDEKSLKCKLNNKYHGTITPIFSETACVLDESKGQVYIYGGWHPELNWFAIDRITKSPNILRGRYTSVCIQIDLKIKEIRCIEPLTYLIGPEMRASSVLGFYDNKLLISGGYTTIDNDENNYDCPRCFGDEWVCVLVPEELLNNNNNNENNENLQTEPLSSSGQMSEDLAQSKKLISKIDFPELLDKTVKSVFLNFEYRKILTDCHPQGHTGCILVKVYDKNKFYTEEQIFKSENLLFMSPQQLCSKFPKFQQSQLYNALFTRDPENYTIVLFYVDFFYDKNMTTFFDPFLFFQYGFYARYGQQPVYKWEQPLAQDGFKKSLNIPISNENRPNIKMDYDTCRYDKCPNAEMIFKKATFDALSEEDKKNICLFDSNFGKDIEKSEIKLKFCTKCRLVQYCSRECQVGDWSKHKVLCKASTLSSTK